MELKDESKSLYREFNEVIDELLAQGADIRYIMYVLRKELHGITWKAVLVREYRIGKAKNSVSEWRKSEKLGK